MRLADISKWALLVWLAIVIVAAFFYVHAAEGFIGESSRIVFFHVPMAWIAVLAFLVSCITSVMYLRRRDPKDDIRASVSAGLGLLFAVLATTTGAVFAKIMWGAYWNWDPRQTSITILLLIYAAYFALRSAVPDPEKRATLSAVYSILAFVTVPFLMFVVPRIYWSLHPDVLTNPDPDNRLDSAHIRVLMASLAGFTYLYVWLYTIGSRIEAIRHRRRQEVL